jgi:Cytochrome c3
VTGLIKIGLGLAAVLGPAFVFFQQADRKVFLPGHTSPGHHQIEQKCESCHTPFGGVAQESCVACHGEGLSAAEDSHSTGKFEDPRNALQLGQLDATHCVACHLEHRPTQTDAVGVTARAGFCVECHRDVGRERASHADLAFTSCTNIGCHNFHDNRAIYGDFLGKHRGEPDLLPKPSVPLRGTGAVAMAALPSAAPGVQPGSGRAEAPAVGAAGTGRPEGPDAAPPAAAAPAGGQPGELGSTTTLAAVATVAPDAPSAIDDRGGEGSAGRAIATAAWQRSAHARAGVSCGGCHRAGGKAEASWSWRPDPTVACARCHEDERRTFSGGKHGMRIAAGLPPMRPADALVPAKMKTQAVANVHEAGLTCARCHDAHAPDLRQAAVESCEGCHDDGHTRTYRASAHFARWQAELAGTAAPGSGVSCATCHLPRAVDRTGDAPRVWVDHNQNGNLRPVDKMARSVCMSCHGLAFSLASLADADLVARNFNGRPRPVRTGFDLLTRSSP